MNAPIASIGGSREWSRNVAERFWAKANVLGPDECWLWRASVTSRGYGRFRLHGKSRGAHCVAWLLDRGPIPPGQLVLHRCDVPLCCNPAHLFLGTQGDNVADMDAKGRRNPSRGPRDPRKPVHKPRAPLARSTVVLDDVRAWLAARRPARARDGAA